jgi:hypothetical protein
MSADAPTRPGGTKQVSVETAASRPSKTNCETAAGGFAQTQQRYRKQKYQLVEQLRDEAPNRAIRPLTVRDSIKVRDDVVYEGIDGTVKASSLTDTLGEFLNWYNDYRTAHLAFISPDGEMVRSPMQNSHQPRYGDTYYAKIKDFERAILDAYDEPYCTMLTLSGSSKNANGGWRCPADHLRDVVSSWRPENDNGVYHTLRYELEEKRDLDWEYCLVVENHQSGYGHVHVAIFTDGRVTHDTFKPAIDAHLRHCSIAGPDAHNYHDHEHGPISINAIEPGDCHGDAYGDEEPIGNLGSYIGEYIGAHGDELFERSIEELQFRATCWATGTQRVRFSNGANELIKQHRSPSPDGGPAETVPNGWREDVTAEDIEDACEDDDGCVADLLAGDHAWGLRGVGRMDDRGEELYDTDDTGVEWRQVEPKQEIDPPKHIRFARPQPQSGARTLDEFGGSLN